MTSENVLKAMIFTMVFLFLVVILIMIFCIRGAAAHDLEHPNLDQWYSELHSHIGGPCCDGSDFGKGSAAHLEPQDWGTQDRPNSHYTVFLEGEWRDVPDSAVVDVPNVDGRALVWFYSIWTSPGVKVPTIRCFMPGTMS